MPLTLCVPIVGPAIVIIVGTFLIPLPQLITIIFILTNTRAAVPTISAAVALVDLIAGAPTFRAVARWLHIFYSGFQFGQPFRIGHIDHRQVVIQHSDTFASRP